MKKKKILKYESGQAFVADLRATYGTEGGNRLALRYLEIPLPKNEKERAEEILFREQMQAVLA